MHGPRGDYINFIRPDQRPPLVGAAAAADSLWGRVTESALGDGIADACRADLEQLVRRFAPTIVLPPADQVRVGDRRYRLLPIDAAVYADTLRLDVVSTSPYRFTGPVDVPLRTLTLDSLRGLVRAGQRYESEVDQLATWYFDFPGGNPREWWEEYARLRTGPDSARWAQPTVYAHPFTDHLGRVVIQYWYFYPFNDAVGNHEGDWEHVNVILSPSHDAIAGIDYFFHARSVAFPKANTGPRSLTARTPSCMSGDGCTASPTIRSVSSRATTTRVRTGTIPTSGSGKLQRVWARRKVFARSAGTRPA